MRLGSKGEVEIYLGSSGTVYTEKYLLSRRSDDRWCSLRSPKVLFYDTILSIASGIGEYLPAPPRYGTVIFDLDGTLLDTLQDLAAAVDHALEGRGFPLHTLQEYRSMVGHGVRNLVKNALPAEVRQDEALVDGCLADFTAYYTAHIDDRTRPYPGMAGLVEKLAGRGVRLAVASNKFQEGAEKLVAEFFPGIRFAAVLGNRPGCPLKPDPEIVNSVLRVTGSEKGAAVLVGDSPTDMKTAAAGGIAAIAVTWGYREMPPSASYALCSTPQELLSLLL